MALDGLYTWMFCVCSPLRHYTHSDFSPECQTQPPELILSFSCYKVLSSDSAALLWKTSLPFLCKSMFQAGYFYSANVTIIHPGTKMSNPGFSPPFYSPSVPPCFLFSLSWSHLKALLIPPFKHSTALFPTHCLPYFWPPQLHNYYIPFWEVFSSPGLHKSQSHNPISLSPPVSVDKANLAIKLGHLPLASHPYYDVPGPTFLSSYLTLLLWSSPFSHLVEHMTGEVSYILSPYLRVFYSRLWLLLSFQNPPGVWLHGWASPVSLKEMNAACFAWLDNWKHFFLLSLVQVV